MVSAKPPPASWLSGAVAGVLWGGGGAVGLAFEVGVVLVGVEAVGGGDRL
jgi:hypothetical protein